MIATTIATIRTGNGNLVPKKVYILKIQSGGND